MALRKQLVPVSMDGGLDSKTDEKLVLPGRFPVLRNAVFTTGRRLTKRNGYTALGTGVVGSSEAITAGSWLGTFQDELLAQLGTSSGQQLFAYTASSDEWVAKGTLTPLTISTEPVIRNDSQQRLADLAVDGGVAVYAWEDGRGGVRATALDQATGTPLVGDTEMDGSGGRPRCIAFSGQIFVLYAIPGSNTIKARRLSPANPTSFDSAVTLATDLHGSNSHFDVYEFGTHAVYVWNTNSASIKAAYLRRDGTVGASIYGLPGPTSVAEVAENCLGLVCHQANRQVYVYYHNTTDGVRGFVLAEDFATDLSPTTIDSTTATDMVNIAGTLDGTTLRVFWEETHASDAWRRKVHTNTLTLAGSAGTAEVLARSVGLATKAWTDNGNTYVGVVHDSTLQATVFIMNLEGCVVGKVLPGLSGGVTSKASLPRVAALADNMYRVPLRLKTRFVSEDVKSFANKDQSVTYSLTGIATCKLDFSNNAAFLTGQLGEKPIITGGVLVNYDGISATEHGFHLFPENISLSQSASGGSMSDGTYEYIVVWEWTDNRGLLHRSAPSVPVSITVNGGGSSQKVTVTIPTLRLTEKRSPRDNVVAAVFRTEDAGTVFYKVSSISSPTTNDPTTDTITHDDTLADASITDNEVLYTAGGVIEHIAPPAASIVVTGKNRVFIMGLEDENLIWFSKEIHDGEGAAFSDALIIRVDPNGGAITGGAVLDDKVVVFKQRQIFVFAGDGPNATGQQGSFSAPERITSDVGCNNRHSIVNTPTGLMFQSEKGIYELGRDLQVRYVGADVQGFNDLSITRAVLAADANQVRFATSSDTCLVYDYFYGQWSTFTGHAAAYAVNWQGRYTFLRTDGQVRQESPGFFKDVNAGYRLEAETAWLQVAGLQGFQRVYKALVLGNYLSDHRLKVGVAYNFQPGFAETHVINAGNIIDATYWGSDSYWGESSPWGGVEDGVYQFEVRPNRQKCQSIRFRFEDLVESDPKESYNLVGLSLLVGLKPGLHRVATSKRA